MYELILTI